MMSVQELETTRTCPRCAGEVSTIAWSIHPATDNYVVTGDAEPVGHYSTCRVEKLGQCADCTYHTKEFWEGT